MKKLIWGLFLVGACFSGVRAMDNRDVGMKEDVSSSFRPSKKIKMDSEKQRGELHADKQNA